jgi:hypothetical protein
VTAEKSRGIYALRVMKSRAQDVDLLYALQLRIYQTTKVTPAIAAGVAKKL